MRNHVVFAIGPLQFMLRFNWFLATVKFLDMDLMLSQIPESPTEADWCLGIKYVVELFDMKALLETSVYTCQFPMNSWNALSKLLVGSGPALTDWDDCLWMWYPIEQPIADSKSVFPVLKMLDLEGDILPWTCSYDYYASLIENIE